MPAKHKELTPLLHAPATLCVAPLRFQLFPWELLKSQGGCFILFVPLMPCTEQMLKECLFWPPNKPHVSCRCWSLPISVFFDFCFYFAMKPLGRDSDFPALHFQVPFRPAWSRRQTRGRKSSSHSLGTYLYTFLSSQNKSPAACSGLLAPELASKVVIGVGKHSLHNGAEDETGWGSKLSPNTWSTSLNFSELWFLHLSKGIKVCFGVRTKWTTVYKVPNAVLGTEQVLLL